jgi:hypothetical protein
VHIMEIEAFWEGSIKFTFPQMPLAILYDNGNRDYKLTIY